MCCITHYCDDQPCDNKKLEDNIIIIIITILFASIALSFHKIAFFLSLSFDHENFVSWNIYTHVCGHDHCWLFQLCQTKNDWRPCSSSYRPFGCTHNLSFFHNKIKSHKIQLFVLCFRPHSLHSTMCYQIGIVFAHSRIRVRTHTHIHSLLYVPFTH